MVVFYCLTYYNAHLVYAIGVLPFRLSCALIAVGDTAASGGEVLYWVIVKTFVGTLI
jgi:hypothetical protein